MTAHFSPEFGLIDIIKPVQLGGTKFSGRLRRFLRCPICNKLVRVIATFDKEEDCNIAINVMKQQGYAYLEYEQSGKTLVGSTGAKNHDYRSSSYYGHSGDGCTLVPFFGLPREFLVEIWEKLHRRTYQRRNEAIKPIPLLPSGTFDIERLDGVHRVRDEVDLDAPRLIMAHRGWGDHPTGMIVPYPSGGSVHRYTEYQKMVENVGEQFVKKVFVAPQRLTTD